MPTPYTGCTGSGKSFLGEPLDEDGDAAVGIEADAGSRSAGYPQVSGRVACHVGYVYALRSLMRRRGRFGGWQ
jgi:hypothetical protein